MDRVRCFSMLGLSENATKEQVKRAYGKKLAVYKGPNYAEEPEYAERKIAQLRQAYEEAYALAETNVGTYGETRGEREIQPEKKKKTTKRSQLLDAERDEETANKREKFHQWLEQRDDKKHSRKDGVEKKRKKVEKVDFSKLKDKLQEIKAEVATQLDLGASDEEPTQEYILTEQMAEADGDDEKRYTLPPTKSKNGELIGTVISLAVAMLMLFTGSCDDNSPDYSYDEPSSVYIFDMDSEQITDGDRDIVDLADASHSLVLDQNEQSSSYIEHTIETEDEEKANQFAQYYWNKDSILEVSEYLYQNYGGYVVSADEPVAEQLDAIFAFYGFASLETASWYEQPYTGEKIQSYGDYLDYLNRFYEEQ